MQREGRQLYSPPTAAGVMSAKRPHPCTCAMLQRNVARPGRAHAQPGARACLRSSAACASAADPRAASSSLPSSACSTLRRPNARLLSYSACSRASCARRCTATACAMHREQGSVRNQRNIAHFGESPLRRLKADGVGRLCRQEGGASCGKGGCCTCSAHSVRPASCSYMKADNAAHQINSSAVYPCRLHLTAGQYMCRLPCAGACLVGGERHAHLVAQAQQEQPSLCAAHGDLPDHLRSTTPNSRLAAATL